MAKHKENRTIPPLVISKDDNETAFDSSGIVETEDFFCFGITPPGTRSLCIKLKKHQHSETLIQYSRLISPLIYNYKKLRFETATTRVELEGANLKPLLYYLGEQRLAWVQPFSLSNASPTDEMMMKEGEPKIISIEIVDKAKEAAKRRAEAEKANGDNTPN